MSKQDLETHAFSSRLEYYNDLIFMSVQESTMAVSAHLTLLEFSQRLWKLNANSLISVLATSHRIDFKLLLVVYKSPNGLAPKYISQFPLPSRPLRSSGKGLLTVPRKKQKKQHSEAGFGYRRFVCLKNRTTFVFPSAFNWNLHRVRLAALQIAFYLSFYT